MKNKQLHSLNILLVTLYNYVVSFILCQPNICMMILGTINHNQGVLLWIFLNILSTHEPGNDDYQYLLPTVLASRYPGMFHCWDLGQFLGVNK